MLRSSTTSERTEVENFNLNDLMAQAAAMQSQLQSAQDKLAATELTGTAGGGLVTATIKGTGELVGLSIKPEACDPEDTETLADLIIAAVRDANGKAADVQQAFMPQMPDLGF
ncbi:MAG: YbaB/EbfC family nucleoid-associated protein [Actinobacteria bacterium]|nr:YbaB/EbfC family nucleoid-associated protein [Actinomycetota bacterium]